MTWTAPVAAPAAAALTSTFWDQQVKGNLDVIGGAWTAYTPTWTALSVNPTLGNGVLVGAYRATGKTVDFRVKLTIGSTTSATGAGAFRFALPPNLTPHGDISAWFPYGTASLQDISAPARYLRHAFSDGGTTIALADADGTQVTQAVPFSIGVGDIIQIHGRYEAA